MADSSEEISVINHLLKVEKEAYSLIDDAVKDSEEKLASARAESDAEFNKKYNECVRVLEDDYKKNIESLSDNHKKLLDEFKETLVNKPKNQNAFNDFLDKILFAPES